MKTGNCVFVMVVLAFLFGGYSLANGAEKKPGLIFNADDGQASDATTIKDLQEYVDIYAGTGISQFFFCVNSQRTTYDSKVWDSLWDGMDIDELKKASLDDWMKTWILNAWLLNEKDIDTYAVRIARCREKGISPAISMRMNDVHFTVDISHPLHSTFWREHPEYWRVVPPNKDGIVNHWERALDYEHKEVRDYSMLLVKEILERYDIDALELDWMREPYVFRPGRGKIGLDIMTEFMRKVRQLTKEWSSKRGHPIKLVVRVPATPQIAEGFGLDAVGWAKEGLVDMLVVAPYVLTSDFDIPIELWRQLLGEEGKNVKIAACLEGRLQACYWGSVYNFSGGTTNTIETAGGFAAAMLDRGADNIYLFNNFFSSDSLEKRQEYRDYISNIGQMETVIDKPRRHPVTFRFFVSPGMAITHLLPAVVRAEPQQFRIYTGPKPTKGKAIIRVGLDKKPKRKFFNKLFSPLSSLLGKKAKKTELTAKLNSVLCKPIKDHESPEEFFSARVAQFEIPLDAMQRGYNLVEVASQEDNIKQNIVWVEIYIVP